MKPDGTGRMFAVIATGLATSAAVAGMQVYLVRELVIELLFFCILLTAIGIAVAVLLVIDELTPRAFLWLRVQITWAYLHLRHASAARGVVSAIHKS